MSSTTAIAVPVAPAAAMADKAVSFDYKFLPVSDLDVKTEEDPKTGKPIVQAILVEGEELVETDRFWTSLFARYGFNKAFFKYYTHAEVFKRISNVEKNDRMRLCIERDEAGKGTLLAVSNPTKPIVVYDELMELLGRYGNESLTYSSGIVESQHQPRIGTAGFNLCGDDFVNRFMMATPIDGYGGPNIYLSLLRQVCQNGLIGYAKHFKAGLAIGKGDDEVAPSLVRALEGFNNEEGFSAIRERLESAANSWASIYEAQELYKIVTRLYAHKLISDMGSMDMASVQSLKAVNLSRYLLTTLEGQTVADGLGSPILKAFHNMTGDISRLYGLANPEALSQKKRRTLPVNTTVYDLINFATEVATHYALPSGARMLNAFVGTILVEEFDMEGTREKFLEFKDFHVEASAAVLAAKTKESSKGEAA